MARFRTRSSSISITRRGVLQWGLGSSLALGLPSLHAATSPGNDFRCIFLNLVGGPSHLDTWDPKPHAPSDYRGPFRPISTNVPGIQISELFPQMARLADKYTLVRSVFHDAAPIHETGHHLMQTGKVQGAKHVGTQLTNSGLLLPGKIENTGVDLGHGQEELIVVSPSQFRLESERQKLRDAYGQHEFGQSCLMARQAIEQGHRFVTVNMFRTVYDSLSWDCHADGGALNVKLSDYRDKVAPMFDAAYSTLLLDLEARGLLESTLVVAAGEFGRSPKINLRGGRDHWTGVWTVLFAGGGVRGGQVIGGTDRLGCEPVTRPVHASAIANTILHAAGRRPTVHHEHGEPIRELFSRVLS